MYHAAMLITHQCSLYCVIVDRAKLELIKLYSKLVKGGILKEIKSSNIFGDLIIISTCSSLYSMITNDIKIKQQFSGIYIQTYKIIIS